MVKSLNQFLRKTNHWNFVWITLIMTETFTAVMNSLQSYIYYGRISRELMVIGTIDALIVTLIAAPVVIYFLKHNDDLEKKNEELTEMQDSMLQAKLDWEETFNIINDAITIHDKDFNIVRANSGAEKLLGIPFMKISRQKCFESYHGSDCPKQDCPSCRTLMTGDPSLAEIFEPHLNKYLEIKALPKKSANNEIIGLVHVVKDITQQKQTEMEQRKLESQLLQIQKMDSIGRLAGGIAHDFNNILSAIIGYSEIALLKLPKDSPVRETIQTVKESGSRAAALTHQLLAFSRKQVLRMEPVCINVVIESMAKMLSRIIGEDITLVINAQSNINSIMADARQIEQVILNLAVNARDAMPEGGSLVIGTEDIELDESYLKVHEEARPGLYVMISVSDTGRGMPPEIMERIFEPFFTTKELGKGTGLGLATVYGIIKQHNGFIYVYSEPDRGTTFKIYLPAGKEEAMAELQSDTEDMPSGSETIVVVDDDTLVRRLAVDTLQPLGYTVIEAQSGEDAVRAIDNYHGTIDLLLTDVIMPGINGAELARLFRTKRPGKKVVFMSGYTDDAISRHGVLNRDVILINKPIIPHKLAQEVRRALDNKGAGSS